MRQGGQGLEVGGVQAQGLGVGLARLGQLALEVEGVSQVEVQGRAFRMALDQRADHAARALVLARAIDRGGVEVQDLGARPVGVFHGLEHGLERRVVLARLGVGLRQAEPQLPVFGMVAQGAAQDTLSLDVELELGLQAGQLDGELRRLGCQARRGAELALRADVVAGCARRAAEHDLRQHPARRRDRGALEVFEGAPRIVVLQPPKSDDEGIDARVARRGQDLAARARAQEPGLDRRAVDGLQALGRGQEALVVPSQPGQGSGAHRGAALGGPIAVAEAQEDRGGDREQDAADHGPARSRLAAQELVGALERPHAAGNDWLAPEEALQVVGQLRDRVEAPLLAPGHGASDDAHQLPGHRAVAARDRRHGRVRDVTQDLERILSVVRCAQGQELVEHRTQAVDVRAHLGAFAAPLLGRHVVGRAEQIAGGGHGLALLVHGQAEVDQDRRARAGHDQVAGLEVAVQEPVLVDGLHGARGGEDQARGALVAGTRAGQLEGVVDRDALGVALAGLGQVLRQGAPLDQLHHEVGRQRVGLHADDAHDPRVIQPREDLALAPEALAGARRQGHERVQLLQRQGALGRVLVHDPEHTAHPAMAQGAEHPVGADARGRAAELLDLGEEPLEGVQLEQGVAQLVVRVLVRGEEAVDAELLAALAALDKLGQELLDARVQSVSSASRIRSVRRAMPRE